ncbi:tail protein X [Sphingomonas oligophenolica]|uniref:Phage tail protein n=1 Tax=Sphingomonas oligophenolica TaxID=301154 RepID=A0A502CNE8_9SPHN|nr:tail protein X [Sphingomonas oligophenolica]TPG14353.1 phage tail protein [Sphingomonas oligophenolica]
MASDQLRADQGDTLDGLIWRMRALGPADLDAVLALNPGIAALGPILPLGTLVTVPDAAPAVRRIETVQLWD